MMKLHYTLLFLLTISFRLAAQEEESSTYPLGVFADNQQTLVFGSTINVRQSPAKDASVVAQLSAGDAVTVLATDAATLRLNGWTAPWVKIAFRKDGKRLEGYAWAGVFSPSSVRLGDVTIVYGITKAEIEKIENAGDGGQGSSGKYAVEIRALRGNQILSTVATTVFMDGGYYSQFTKYNNLGIKQFKNWVKLSYNFDACGYPSYEIWCAWDGAKLTMLPVLSTISDAGVFFDSESYLFPETEGGLPDVLLYQHEHGEGMIEDGASDYTKQLRTMTWNGKAYLKPKLKGQD